MFNVCFTYGKRTLHFLLCIRDMKVTLSKFYLPSEILKTGKISPQFDFWPFCPLTWVQICNWANWILYKGLSKKIVAAFRGMHVSPAKHSSEKCDRKVWQTDRQTDGQRDRRMDRRRTKWFAGDTKIEEWAYSRRGESAPDRDFCLANSKLYTVQCTF